MDVDLTHPVGPVAAGEVVPGVVVGLLRMKKTRISKEAKLFLDVGRVVKKFSIFFLSHKLALKEEKKFFLSNSLGV